MVADVIDIVNKNLKGEKIRGADIAVLFKNLVVSVAGGPVIGVVVGIIEGLLSVLTWYRKMQLHVFNGYQIGDLPYKSAEASALAADMQKAGAAIVAERKAKSVRSQIADTTVTTTVSPEAIKGFWVKHSQKIIGALGLAALLYLLVSLFKNSRNGG